MNEIQRTVFAPGQSVVVFELNGRPEVFIEATRLHVVKQRFHLSGASLPRVETAARSLLQPVSPTLAEHAHAVLTKLLFAYQTGALILFFASGLRHPLWQPSERLLVVLMGGVFLAVGLHFALAGVVSRIMAEPFAVSMSRGVSSRALRMHGQTGSLGAASGYLSEISRVPSWTYVSAGHSRGLLFSLTTGMQFRHTWVEGRDIEEFLEILRQAVAFQRPAL